MINLFDSIEYHRILFCNIIGKKHATKLSLIYHLLVLILAIVLIENL